MTHIHFIRTTYTPIIFFTGVCISMYIVFFVILFFDEIYLYNNNNLTTFSILIFSMFKYMYMYLYTLYIGTIDIVFNTKENKSLIYISLILFQYQRQKPNAENNINNEYYSDSGKSFASRNRFGSQLYIVQSKQCEFCLS